jgi:HAD superfamily hydrolase (TIGR01509 family)
LQFSGLIFDCDGTLVDSEPIAIKVLVEIAGEHGAILEMESAMRAFRGAKLADCVTYIEQLRGSPVPEDFVPEIRRRIDQRFRCNLQPIAGAEELLRSLSIPICVASNGPRDKMELSLSVTGLLPYFSGRIFSAYEIGHWKPKPDLFIHAARAMNVDAKSCAVIEDSEPGVAAALAASMHVFALSNEHLDVARGEHITPIDSLWQLKDLLNRWL